MVDGVTYDSEAQRRQALKGDAQAQYILALGCSNSVEAVKWLKKAAEQGHRNAEFSLAEHYAEGSGVPKNPAEAIKWYRKAADGGPANIQYWVATRFSSETPIPNTIPPDSLECLKWLRQSAEQGDAHAQAMLGRIYQTGELLPKSEVEARKWLAKAAAQGDPELAACRKAAERGLHEPQFQLGEWYANGEKVAKDTAEAIKWYRKAADGGTAQLQYWVAVRFWNEMDSAQFAPPGIPPRPRHFQIPADPQECLKWLQKSADQGHAPAQAMLGRIYAEGELVPKDAPQGIKWLRKAAQQGDLVAQQDLGKNYLYGTPEGAEWLRKYSDSSHPQPIDVADNPQAAKAMNILLASDYCALAGQYQRGQGVSKNESEAVKWYRKAADLGDWVSQWKLGQMYEEGRGTAKNPAEAAKLYRQSADQGRGYYQIQSQVSLGNLYAEGSGVAQDGFEAIRWYQKAAEKDSPEGLAGIAQVLAFGKGVPKDLPRAVSYYLRAAEKGDMVSQFNLGVFYSKGEGAPRDYVEAYKWYNLAAAAGYPKAAELRDSLTKLMTREQVAAAQQRTRETTRRRPSGNETAHGAQVDSSSTPPRASGSGFFITQDGYFLTSAHVIADADHLVIRTRGATFPASVVKADYANDVALLRASGQFEPIAIISSSTVKLGGAVITIGFPNPQMQGYEPKLTDGKISSLAGAQDDVRFFQISAPVQPGNSGGPLVDARGNAVGVVTARLSDRAAIQASGAIPQNVNYALKSSYVLSFLESLPELANRTKEPCLLKDRPFDEVVNVAQKATALVLVY